MAVGLKIVEGDVVINASGNLEMVEQNEKCARDLGKMLLTGSEYTGNETQFERYNPNYGTELNNKNQYRGLSRMSIRDTVIMLLNAGIKRYLTIQEGRDNLDLGEIITNIDFDVYYDMEDLRELVIEIKFGTAYSNQEISLGQYTQSIE